MTFVACKDGMCTWGVHRTAQVFIIEAPSKFAHTRMRLTTEIRRIKVRILEPLHPSFRCAKNGKLQHFACAPMIEHTVNPPIMHTRITTQ